MNRIQALISLLLLASIASATPLDPRLRLHPRHNTGTQNDAHPDDLDCYASGVADWDKGLHIGAIFIVLAASGLGALLPVVSRYSTVLKVPPTVLTLGTFLGTGVIISTALIHMLPAGSGALNDPCVGGRMGDYSGWPGVLVMVAIFAMHLLEFVMSNHVMESHNHSHKLTEDHTQFKPASEASEGNTIADTGRPTSTELEAGNQKSTVDEIATAPRSAGEDSCDEVAVHVHHNHVHGLSLLDDKKGSKTHSSARVSSYILELGICLHSVIIGLTLSVTAEGFKPLLVAIVFHQFCEGLALGSKIAQVEYTRNGFVYALVNALFFMVITPIGMIIGIGVRSSYAPQSPGALITTGVLDSLSAGILIYSGLVNLLAEEFGTLEFRSYRKPKKAACFASMFAGAGVMALIGKWA